MLAAPSLKKNNLDLTCVCMYVKGILNSYRDSSLDRWYNRRLYECMYVTENIRKRCVLIWLHLSKLGVCMYALYMSTLTLKDGILVGVGVGTLVDGLVVGTEDGLLVGAKEDGFKVGA
jgi:hypothetical protein